MLSHPDADSLKTLHQFGCGVLPRGAFDSFSHSKVTQIASPVDAVISLLVASHGNQSFVDWALGNLAHIKNIIEPDLDEEFPIFRANYLNYDGHWPWAHPIPETYFLPNHLAERQKLIAEKVGDLTMHSAPKPPTPVCPDVDYTLDPMMEEYEQFSPRHILPNLRIWSVPGAFEDVKMNLVYLQSPCTTKTNCEDDQTSILSLVWRIEFEMRDNWYEAYVDAFNPARIHSVVDWVTDYAPHQAALFPDANLVNPVLPERIPDPFYPHPLEGELPVLMDFSSVHTLQEAPNFGIFWHIRRIINEWIDYLMNPSQWLYWRPYLRYYEHFEMEPQCSSHAGQFSDTSRPKMSELDKNGIPRTEYFVWPFGLNNPDEGERKVISNPNDKIASRLGWHATPESQDPNGDTGNVGSSIYYWDEEQMYGHERNTPVCQFATTWGNNVSLHGERHELNFDRGHQVQAQENWAGDYSWYMNYRPAKPISIGSTSQLDDLSIEKGKMAYPQNDIDLAITQAF
jgi:hypothetical protein